VIVGSNPTVVKDYFYFRRRVYTSKNANRHFVYVFLFKFLAIWPHRMDSSPTLLATWSAFGGSNSIGLDLKKYPKSWENFRNW
jgi:hypothetical protein